MYIGRDPANRLVEITAFDNALIRTSGPAHGKTSDRKGPLIRGITFTQYAYRALDIEGKKPAPLVSEEPTDEPVGLSDPATFGKEVVGTTLENVTISFCSRVAGYFRGDGLTIRNSLISDTSTEGIYVIGSSDVLLERNIIRRNNVEQLTGYYPAAVKIFNQTRRVTCRDNLVIEQPYSNGIWYDVGNARRRLREQLDRRARSTGSSSRSPRARSWRATCSSAATKGSACSTAADVRVYDNTFVDTPASFERNERSAVGDHFGWHPSTGPDVGEREGHVFVNNLLVASEAYAKPLLRFEQPKALCEKLPRPQVKELDGNVYARAAGPVPKPLVVWSPAEGESCQVELASLEELRKLQPGFERRGRSFDDYAGALFRSPELRRYELARLLPGLAPVDDLPADVRRLLGWREGENTGARRLPRPPRGASRPGRARRPAALKARWFALTRPLPRDYMGRRLSQEETE